MVARVAGKGDDGEDAMKRAAARSWLAFAFALALAVSPLRVLWANERLGLLGPLLLWAGLIVVIAVLIRAEER
jgi:hypothetical protein